MPKDVVMRDVPEADVQDLENQFKARGAAVEKTKQPDGKWTVKAVYPKKKKN